MLRVPIKRMRAALASQDSRHGTGSGTGVRLQETASFTWRMGCLAALQEAREDLCNALKMARMLKTTVLVSIRFSDRVH